MLSPDSAAPYDPEEVREREYTEYEPYEEAQEEENLGIKKEKGGAVRYESAGKEKYQEQYSVQYGEDEEAVDLAENWFLEAVCGKEGDDCDYEGICRKQKTYECTIKAKKGPVVEESVEFRCERRVFQILYVMVLKQERKDE